MKKIILMFVMALVMLFIGLAVPHAAEWYLYDQFDDGSGGGTWPIDTDRWIIQKDPNASIESIDGMLRFGQDSIGGTTSAFLVFKKSPETIKGVRALVRVKYQEGETCTGDAKGKIGGWFGKSESDYFWNEISLEAPEERVSGSCGILSEDLSDYNEFFWGELPIAPEIIGTWFILTITFSNENKVTYTTENPMGDKNEIIYTLPGELFPTDKHFKAIGFSSESGDGGCAYYFDDVEVLRDEDCQDITVVNTYTLPYPLMFGHGLAFDGTNLWAVDFGPGLIYKLQLNEEDLTTEIIDTIDMATNNPDIDICKGLTFEGKDLWASCALKDLPPIQNKATIYKVDQKGKIKDSFPVPDDKDSTGLTFDGEYLWNAGNGIGIRKLDTKGNLITTYPPPDDQCAGLAFDGQYLWNSDYGVNKIYKVDTSGNVICSYDAPGSCPLGLTFDGTYLWVLDTDGIYQMDINAQ